ncbi:MFS transporter [Asticcacaulis sp. 201]|uniref:MFS transporter n=1 Tax=Asticcacaulis sp. 201 TaxID=3028787 RepID=UPI002916C77B|nr:MFS transporter [Asticcacaulis sp. 201]MDV6333058.1 MFS transporter [Asticcacaulis sp. 201]
MLGASRFDRPTLFYGLAHFGKSLFWYSSEILFAYYLSEVSGMPAQYMGIILAAGFIAGAAADLILGRLLMKTLSNTLGAARLQTAGAVASALMFMLLFTGALVPLPYRLAFALILGLGFRLAYALYDLPQNALLSLATRDNDSRSRVSSLRLFFSGAASLIVALSVGPLLTANLHLSSAKRFFILAVILAVTAVSTSFGLWRVVHGRGQGAQRPEATPVSYIATLKGLPRSLWVIIVSTFIISATVSCFGKVEPYYATYVLKSALWGGVIITSASLGTALSQPVWAYLSLKFSRLTVSSVASAGLALSTFMFWLSAHVPVIAICCAFLFGCASGGLGMILWAAFGDVVSRGNHQVVGTSYGLLTAIIKIALAFGGLMIGYGLSLFDYRGQASAGLVAFMCVPALAGALTVLAFSIVGLRSDKERLL